MTPEPLKILKKGLQILKKSISVKKTKLETQLAKKKSISSSDEHWLDTEANLIDENHVIESLENASDYERGFNRLDTNSKDIVKKLSVGWKFV
jgi:predicted RNase H-like nuclease (RuvC/YqgF family)